MAVVALLLMASACGGGGGGAGVAPSTTVPDVVGLTQAAATSALVGAGLTLGAVSTTASDVVPAGSVVSQDPASGTQVPGGAAVALVVSTGPAGPSLVEVPALPGLPTAEAEAALALAGLTIGQVTTASSATVPAGLVISSSPAAGALALAGSAIDLVVSTGPAVVGGLPPDPASVAPPVSASTATGFSASVAFLYQGSPPVQTGVVPGAISPVRAAVLRGAIGLRDGSPVPGARVSVHGHPELGETLSREDGRYDLAVNGGGQVVLDLEADGFLPVQRTVDVPWNEFAAVPTVVLLPLDPVVTTVALGASALQVARGSTSADADGTRTSTVLVPAGTQATLLLPDGSTAPATSLHVRATEYTLGAAGPAAMPGDLPATSGYTYAVELTADEALAARASHVVFDRPVVHHVENFLGFPVGTPVPLGWYDRVSAKWVAADSGVVLKILSVAGGLATLDVDGSGSPADPAALSALGVDAEEQAALASLYQAGQELWRVRLTHFSAWDCNWGFGPPPDAVGAIPASAGVPVDDSQWQCGSIIGCENQTLGESLPLAGTPWWLHYQSDRVPGHVAARSISMPVTGATVPATLRAIEVRLTIAGRELSWALPAAPVQSVEYTFDGLDAYGRQVTGGQVARFRIGYTYDGTYGVTPRFGYNGNGAMIEGSKTRRQVTVWQEATRRLEPWNAAGAGLGGWSLSVHHAYDPVSRRLLLGDGRQRHADTAPLVGDYFMGGPGARYASTTASDGQLASQTGGTEVEGMAVGPDGSLYFADAYHGLVRRIGPDGRLSTLAGTRSGQPADNQTAADPLALGRIRKLALGPDGSLYVVDALRPRVVRVAPGGVMSTFAGGGSGGDGGLATDAALTPRSVAVAPDGTVYVGERARIRRIGLDGIISTAVGTGVIGDSGDGGRADQAQLDMPDALAVGLDGSLYFYDWQRGKLRRVGPDGRITSLTRGPPPFAVGVNSPDGTRAADAYLGCANAALAVSRSSAIFIGCENGIRRIGPEGFLGTVAGPGVYQTRVPGRALALGFTAYGIAVSPDGTVYTTTQQQAPIEQSILRIGTSLPGVQLGDAAVPSEDGRLVWIFDAAGRHLRTLDGLTGATLLTFGYDAAGRLASVTDADGGATRVDRSGGALAVVGPHGDRTTLTLDAGGWLARLVAPSGQGFDLTADAGGLLTRLADPMGREHTFAYDALGRLVRDLGPDGASTTLRREAVAGGHRVVTTSAGGRTRAYAVTSLDDGSVVRTVTDAAGATRRWTTTPGGDVTEVEADGTRTTTATAADPRWGMAAAYPSIITTTTPGGLARTTTVRRVATLTDPLNPFSVETLVEQVSDGGVFWQARYAGATRTWTLQSPRGRTSTVRLDARGRPIGATAPGAAPASMAYDALGRVSSVTLGSRVWSQDYGLDGRVASRTDPLGRVSSSVRDLLGRVTSTTLPGGRTIATGYDEMGNLTSVTPPGRPAHAITWTAGDQVASSTPPGAGATSYGRDGDRKLVRIDLPGGDAEVLAYAATQGGVAGTDGQLASVASLDGAASFAYDPVGRLAGATRDGVTFSPTWDGFLLTSQAWSGPVAGAVSTTYDTLHRPASTSVAGVTAAYTFDEDGLVTGAGQLQLLRDAATGLAASLRLGVLSTDQTFDADGALATVTTTAAARSLLSQSFTRDGLGRVTGIVETVEGTTRTLGFTYDAAGRLTGVSLDGVAEAAYAYDGQGNRTGVTSGGVSGSATFDVRDRLLTAPGSTSTWTAAGALASRTAAGATTSFVHDAQGRLRHATLPDGRQVDYLLDGAGRRVGKRVDGALTDGFLHDGRRPVAWLDGAGAVRAVFVYRPNGHVPDYLVNGDGTFRFVTDHVGSPRLLVNAATGAVAQRLDFDAFGQVLSDSNPGFQPFGFAGGLLDRDTGLVHFGAREYDPANGRWTSPDPLGFGGGDTNLYAYVGNDPVNLIDPSGLEDEPAPAAVPSRYQRFMAIHPSIKKAVDWSLDWVMGKGKSVCTGPLCMKTDEPTVTLGAKLETQVGGETVATLEAECEGGLTKTPDPRGPLFRWRMKVGASVPKLAGMPFIGQYFQSTLVDVQGSAGEVDFNGQGTNWHIADDARQD